MTTICVTVSGSFTRHLSQIQRAVAEFKQRGVRVLSPEQPTIVESLDGFVFVASDRHRSIRLVQDRHLSSISKSDLLWLETPDGYVGPSAALEIGFAIASGVPVFSTRAPDDLTMRQYVTRVPSLAGAIAAVARTAESRGGHSVSLLVDPDIATDIAATGVAHLRSLLGRQSGASVGKGLHAAVVAEKKRVTDALELPTAILE